MLTVSSPEIGTDEGGTFRPLPPASSYALNWAKPVLVRSPVPRDERGVAVLPQTLSRLGFVVTRRASPGAVEESWSTEASAWAPLSTLMSGGSASEHLELGPFEYAPDGSHPFRGMALLADEARFVRAPAGAFPRYAIRSYFQTDVDGVRRAGMSGPTAFYPVSIERAFLASIEAERGDTPEWIEMYLLDPARTARAKVELRRTGPQAGVQAWSADASGREHARVRALETGAVEIASHPTDPTRRAHVSIESNGDIRIAAASGRRVFVGSLEITVVGSDLHLRNAGGGELVIESDVRIAGELDVDGAVRLGSRLDVDGVVSARGWSTTP